MDYILTSAKKVLDFFSGYPEIVALIGGTFIGYVFTIMIETYFLPIETDFEKLRRQKGLTFIMCWGASGAASAILWAFLDPRDIRAERITVSYLVGVLSFAAYPMLARLATYFWPKVGSAWTAIKPPENKP